MDLIQFFEGLVWSPPLLLFLVGVGAYLTWLLRGFQFRYLGYGLTLVFHPHEGEGKGDISHFKALMTSLAGAIGTGSIVGIAVGVSVGGLGSIFWMWVTALFGMATKYAEAVLAIRYRKEDHRGEMIGGPMHYIEKGTGWHWLAVAYALVASIAVLGTGNLVQVNSIADAAEVTFGLNRWVTGGLIGCITGVVLMGGVRSIGTVAGVLVPVMAALYLMAGGWILAVHYTELPQALWLIMASAFTGKAALGGAAGSGIFLAIQTGVSKGVFTNESGLGISSIAAAAARTDMPGRQAVVAMTGTFLSTLVICTMTGLVLAVTGVLDGGAHHANGAGLCMEAFDSAIPFGGGVVSIGLVLFAYSTAIGWAYYGEKCFEYLFGEERIGFYRLLFVLLMLPGAALDLEVVWGISNVMNGVMVVPNLIGLVALAHVVKQETDRFRRAVESK